jgi:hypothetical protein
MEIPPFRYARSGDVSIAYQGTGEGNPLDLVFAPDTVSHLALEWDRPFSRMLIERLSRFVRLIRFDKRGTGMSDRMAKAATLEERTDDIRAARVAVFTPARLRLSTVPCEALMCTSPASSRGSLKPTTSWHQSPCGTSPRDRSPFRRPWYARASGHT